MEITLYARVNCVFNRVILFTPASYNAAGTGTHPCKSSMQACKVLHTPIARVYYKASVIWQRRQCSGVAKLADAAVRAEHLNRDAISAQLDQIVVVNVCNYETAVRGTFQDINWVVQTLLFVAHHCHRFVIQRKHTQPMAPEVGDNHSTAVSQQPNASRTRQLTRTTAVTAELCPHAAIRP
jgi:hypothetical protein